MRSRRHYIKAKHTRKHNRSGGAKKRVRSGKKWTTAIHAANITLKRTGSITAAKQSLKKQALRNARLLFGSV